jgi:CHAT domain-containing protein
MNRSSKTLVFIITSFFYLQPQANSQEQFIDSIRTMLIDLDSSIQFAPINLIVKHSIPFCAGKAINDTLTMDLKSLLSEDYIYSSGLKQAVSPHLLTRYSTFLIRISVAISENDNHENDIDNTLRVGMCMLNASRENGNSFLLQRAKDIFNQTSPTVSYNSARSLYYYAKTFPANHKGDSGYILFKRSIAFNPRRTADENLLYANTLYSLGAYCYAQNKQDTAFILFRNHLDQRKKIHGKNSAEYAYWMIVTADQYTYLSKYEIAQNLNFAALDLTRSTIGKENSQYALCLNDIAEVYYRIGEFDKSLPYAQQSLDLKRKLFGKNYFDNVVSLHNLATLYTRMGMYNEAIPLLKESLEISKKYFGERMVYAFDLQPLAEAYTYMGEYEKALPLYQRSLDIQQQIQRDEGGNEKNIYYVNVLHSIATLYTRIGQYEKAVELFNQTLQIKRELYGTLNPEYAKTLNSYAEACLLKGDYGTALILQRESLSLGRKMFGNRHPNIATGLINLARVYFAQKNFAKAYDASSEGLEMQKTIFRESHPDIATSLDLIGDIMAQTNRVRKALAYYKQSFTLRKQIMAATHPDYISSLYKLGVIYDKMDSVSNASNFLMKADQAALKHIQQSYISLSEEEKLTYLRKTENQFNLLPSFLYRRRVTDPSIANRIYENAVVLKRMVLVHQQQVYNSIRKSKDTTALRLYNEWRFNKALLGQQLIVPAAFRMPTFNELLDATAQKERQLSLLSASFRKLTLQAEASERDIQQHLKKNEAAVEFVRFRLFTNNWTDSILYAALVLLPQNKDATFVFLCEEKQLKRLLRYSNNTGEAAITYLYPGHEKSTNVSNELYRVTWRSLQPILKNSHTVYYSPVGLLNKISFAAIQAENGKYLSNEYDLRQLLCTRTLESKHDSLADYSSASLWGNIDYDNNDINIHGDTHDGESHHELNYPPRNWKRLPGTKSEIENILQILNGEKVNCAYYSDVKANEETFKKMDGNATSIVHIATHGFFIPPTANSSVAMLRSGLLLAGSNETWNGRSNIAGDDGILTAYEISDMDLGNTELLTLSACETALGDIEDNEGVFGLQRAFKMAGVKSLLMTLWTVPDKETSEFMIKFYRTLVHDRDPNEALRKTQAAMKEKYAPYYWAGFVLTE